MIIIYHTAAIVGILFALLWLILTTHMLIIKYREFAWADKTQHAKLSMEEYTVGDTKHYRNVMATDPPAPARSCDPPRGETYWESGVEHYDWSKDDTFAVEVEVAQGEWTPEGSVVPGEMISKQGPGERYPAVAEMMEHPHYKTDEDSSAMTDLMEQQAYEFSELNNLFINQQFKEAPDLDLQNDDDDDLPPAGLVAGGQELDPTYREAVVTRAEQAFDATMTRGLQIMKTVGGSRSQTQWAT